MNAQHRGGVRPAQARGDLQNVDEGEVVFAEFHRVFPFQNARIQLYARPFAFFQPFGRL
jgi:hypothetical protein